MPTLRKHDQRTKTHYAASLLVDQDRRPARPIPSEDHRLVRDPSMGWHVPVSNLGYVVRLTVARWW